MLKQQILQQQRCKKTSKLHERHSLSLLLGSMSARPCKLYSLGQCIKIRISSQIFTFNLYFQQAMKEHSAVNNSATKHSKQNTLQYALQPVQYFHTKKPSEMGQPPPLLIQEDMGYRRKETKEYIKTAIQQKELQYQGGSHIKKKKYQAFKNHQLLLAYQNIKNNPRAFSQKNTESSASPLKIPKVIGQDGVQHLLKEFQQSKDTFTTPGKFPYKAEDLLNIDLSIEKQGHTIEGGGSSPTTKTHQSPKLADVRPFPQAANQTNTSSFLKTQNLVMLPDIKGGRNQNIFPSGSKSQLKHFQTQQSWHLPMDKNAQPTQGSFLAAPGSPQQQTASSNDTIYNFTNTKGFNGAQHYFSSAKATKLKAKGLNKNTFTPLANENNVMYVDPGDLKNILTEYDQQPKKVVYLNQQMTSTSSPSQKIIKLNVEQFKSTKVIKELVQTMHKATHSTTFKLLPTQQLSLPRELNTSKMQTVLVNLSRAQPQKVVLSQQPQQQPIVQQVKPILQPIPQPQPPKQKIVAIPLPLPLKGTKLQQILQHKVASRNNQNLELAQTLPPQMLQIVKEMDTQQQQVAEDKASEGPFKGDQRRSMLGSQRLSSTSSQFLLFEQTLLLYIMIEQTHRSSSIISKLSHYSSAKRQLEQQQAQLNQTQTSNGPGTGPMNTQRKKKALKIIQKQMQQALILHHTQTTFEGPISRAAKINSKKLDKNNQRAAYSLLHGIKRAKVPNNANNSSIIGTSAHPSQVNLPQQQQIAGKVVKNSDLLQVSGIETALPKINTIFNFHIQIYKYC